MLHVMAQRNILAGGAIVNFIKIISFSAILCSCTTSMAAIKLIPNSICSKFSNTTPSTWNGEWQSETGNMFYFSTGAAITIYGFEKSSSSSYKLDCVANDIEKGGKLNCIGKGHSTNSSFIITSDFSMANNKTLKESWKIIHTENISNKTIKQEGNTNFRLRKSFVCKKYNTKQETR